MAKTPYDIDLEKNPANFQPLTPLAFLERAAKTFPKHTAIIHDVKPYVPGEFFRRELPCLLEVLRAVPSLRAGTPVRPSSARADFAAMPSPSHATASSTATTAMCTVPRRSSGWTVRSTRCAG